MRIITLHCDYIRYQALKKAVKDAEELSNQDLHEVKECLVVLTAVEKGDSEKEVAELLAAVKKTASEVKARNLVLYPYAHLSSNLSSPSLALELMKKAELELKKEFTVARAPFGYYKMFELKVKGHPLSELSKTFGKLPESIVTHQKKAAHAPQKIILDRRNLKPNDHRILGEDLKLFTFSDEVGAGLPLWLPNGETIKNTLINFMRVVEEKYGYKYVSTPHITKGHLYEKSGHLQSYSDSMYAPMVIEGVDYYLRPMNCPHHHMIYNKLVHSYRDLPLRLAEAGMVYRNELSGVTYGLIRVKGFVQNDSHLYITPEQLNEEFVKVMEMFDKVYSTVGMKDYWFRLSLPDFKANPDKFTGDVKEWEYASEEIRKAMKASGKKVIEEKGEAAFYGPKIDVQIKNSLGKEETIATSQVDIVVPKRMNLTYTDAHGAKKHPIIIHRAVLGSYERFVAYLLEQTEGKLPLWLAPIQVRVVSFTNRNEKAVTAFAHELTEHGFRVDTDVRDIPMDGKIRDAELMKINYIVVIGDKEEKSNTLAVRQRGEKPKFDIKKETFLTHLHNEREVPYKAISR